MRKVKIRLTVVIGIGRRSKVDVSAETHAHQISLPCPEGHCHDVRLLPTHSRARRLL